MARGKHGERLLEFRIQCRIAQLDPCNLRERKGTESFIRDEIDVFLVDGAPLGPVSDILRLLFHPEERAGDRIGRCDLNRFSAHLGQDLSQRGIAV